MNTQPVELGDKAKDVITGFEGIAIAITIWLNGCRRITLQATDKDGMPRDYTCDIEQIEVTKKGAVTLPRMSREQAKSRESGGPMPTISRATTPPQR